MANRVDCRTKNRPSSLAGYASLVEGVDEFIFAPLGSATPVNGIAEPAETGGDRGDGGSDSRANAA